jgi:hypothetical protein
MLGGDGKKKDDETSDSVEPAFEEADEYVADGDVK